MLRVDGVVGGIVVGDQHAVELVAQQLHGAFLRPVVGDLIDRDIFVAAEPDVMAHAIFAPCGLVSVRHTALCSRTCNFSKIGLPTTVALRSKFIAVACTIGMPKIPESTCCTWR